MPMSVLDVQSLLFMADSVAGFVVLAIPAHNPRTSLRLESIGASLFLSDVLLGVVLITTAIVTHA